MTLFQSIPGHWSRPHWGWDWKWILLCPAFSRYYLPSFRWSSPHWHGTGRTPFRKHWALTPHTQGILITIIICLAHTDCQLSLPSTGPTFRAHIWEPLLWRCTSEINSRIKLCRPVVYFSSSSPTTFPLDCSYAVLSRLSLPCELNELSSLKLSQTAVFVVANKHW